MSESRTLKVITLFDRILITGSILAGAMLFFMMLSVCYDVIARYAFNAPTVWADEISSIFLLYLPFFAGAWILKKDGHVKMDLVLNYMSPRKRLILGIISSIVICLVCAAFVVYGFKVTWNMFEIGYKTDTNLRLFKWPIIFVIPLCFLLILLQAVRNILENLHKLAYPEARL
jgi:C4-dicarboxylate transporter DctQ subunit